MPAPLFGKPIAGAAGRFTLPWLPSIYFFVLPLSVGSQASMSDKTFRVEFTVAKFEAGSLTAFMHYERFIVVQ